MGSIVFMVSSIIILCNCNIFIEVFFLKKKRKTLQAEIKYSADYMESLESLKNEIVDKAHEIENEKLSLDMQCDQIFDRNVEHIATMITHINNIKNQYKLLITEKGVYEYEENRYRCEQNISMLEEQFEQLENYYFQLTGTNFSFSTEWIAKQKLN